MNTLEKLLSLFLLSGVFLTLLAFLGWLNYSILLIIFIFLVSLTVTVVVNFFTKLKFLSRKELLLVYLLIIILSLHFLQVLVPETGFDALWYHLPIAKNILYTAKLNYLTDFYQSLNPQFADLYFLPFFAVLGDLGTKVMAYFFVLFLILMSYKLARIFLDRSLSLIIVILVSLFQVVAWQASSFYIDVAKAFFEVAGVYCLLTFWEDRKKRDLLFLAILFFSASLASKLFSVVLLPIFFYMLILKQKKLKFVKFFTILLTLLSLASLYYAFAYFSTGNPFYSISIHLAKLKEIGGSSDLFQFLVRRSLSLPASLLVMVLIRDYLNPFLSLLWLPVVLRVKLLWKNKRTRLVLLFSVYQWLVWWFVPPTSTRYALSGFITLLIVGVYALKTFYFANKLYQRSFYFLVLVSCLGLLLPRLIVARRSLRYILTDQTQQNYLEQFYDGSINDKIEAWYSDN